MKKEQRKEKRKPINNWSGIRPDVEDYVGFLYKIYDAQEDMYYIGQKTLWNKIRRKPLKGKKRVRLDRNESDWRHYFGSNPFIKSEVEAGNHNRFKGEILKYYKSKSRLNFEEFKLIWDAIVIRKDPNCYNKVLNIRLNLDKLKDE